jgi:hypothetical protein
MLILVKTLLDRIVTDEVCTSFFLVFVMAALVQERPMTGKCDDSGSDSDERFFCLSLFTLFYIFLI